MSKSSKAHAHGVIWHDECYQLSKVDSDPLLLLLQTAFDRFRAWSVINIDERARVERTIYVLYEWMASSGDSLGYRSTRCGALRCNDDDGVATVRWIISSSVLFFLFVFNSSLTDPTAVPTWLQLNAL